MTEKERLITTLNHKQPDKIPHFELQFQLTEEEFGLDYRIFNENDFSTGPKERDEILHHNLNLYRLTAERFNYCAMPIYHLGCFAGLEWGMKELAVAREEYFIDDIMVATFNGGGTFGIPENGDDMLEFSYSFYDKPQEMHELAQKRCRESIELGKRQIDAGVEMIIINTDYAFNRGPFLSPTLFEEFVTPYLTQIVDEFKRQGVWVILHTDGNLMPIIDQLVSTGIHGLQSIDPQAGMDIAEVKRLYGDKITLMGNVQCSMLQDGPESSIREATRYCIDNASSGGGYIFSTSNCIFKGLPLEHYKIMLDEYQHRQANCV